MRLGVDGVDPYLVVKEWIVKTGQGAVFTASEVPFIVTGKGLFLLGYLRSAQVLSLGAAMR